MADRDEIISFCDELLGITSFNDYGPNGLQVPGTTEITKVATAVSAHLESITAAVETGADLLLTHHGLFWDFHPRALTEAMAERLRVALGAGLNLAGYHLPLDGHPEIGNNVLLVEELGFEATVGEIGQAKGANIGAIGRRAEPIPADELFRLVAERLDREPLVFADGPEMVSRIGVVTGSAASEVHRAIELGLDAFITGEPAEHVMADAREGGIHFLAAGHYATETLGIRRLGDLIADRYEVEHEFIDLPNPI